jgi:hypothetical protein
VEIPEFDGLVTLLLPLAVLSLCQFLDDRDADLTIGCSSKAALAKQEKVWGLGF